MADKVYKMKLLKNEKCDKIVELLVNGGGTIVCADEEMKEIEASTEDEGKEKHVPVLEEITNGINVTVGATMHPMETSHYIQFISITRGMGVYRKFLTPENEPTADFAISLDEVNEVYEHCNKHSLWKKSL